jgi:endonuclease-3
MFSKETRRRRVRKIIPILREEYPDAGSRLNFSNPLELLIASILAAQCTDDRVNEVTKDLFRKYRTAKDYAEADLNELMGEIRSTGTFRRKAARIKFCCEDIVSRYDGEVPSQMEELADLPGVGRKTANMVLVNWFGLPGIIVDTHVARVSNRIGLSDRTKAQANKMEADLMEVVAKKNWSLFSHLLVFHGRKICLARKPKCDQCRINRLCDYFRGHTRF